MHRIPVEDYAATIRELLAPLRDRPDEFVPIALAADRVTAVEVRSAIDLPTFRNSQMDGFAVHAADLAVIPAVLPVLGEVAAGATDPAALAAGSAIAIMTGAPVPPGADAVVPIEDTRRVDGGVEILRARHVGDYVREAGSDLTAGSVLLPAGLRLASRHLAALAAANLQEVTVRSRVRVAVVSTGNELVPPGTPLGHGRSARRERHRPRHRGLRPSVPKWSTRRLHRRRRRALGGHASTGRSRADAELIITSGGISMGAHEVVRQLLEPLGAHGRHRRHAARRSRRRTPATATCRWSAFRATP